MREHDYEPIPGLPERLPAGEKMLWQGKPDWRVLAERAFHVREFALYFGLFLSARGVVAFLDGEGLVMSLFSALAVAPLAAAGTGIILLFAWLTARSTIYTITDRRLVLRFGVAIQICVNLPFRQVDSVALKLFKSGHGDLPLTLKGATELTYAHLWPHARPWKLARPVPMMRSIPDANRVGVLLVDAMTHALREEDESASGVKETRTSASVVGVGGGEVRAFG